MKSVKQIFDEAFNGQTNIMTPKVLEYGWLKKNKICYELSEGKDMWNGKIYGLTVIEVMPDGELEKRRDLRDCYNNLTVAKATIKQLKEDV